MVVNPQPPQDHLTSIRTLKPSTALFTSLPVINLRDPEAKNLIVEACQSFGFFRLVNHGVPIEFTANLESSASEFFSRPQFEKEKSGPPDPFGYGNKAIGPNGDVGWIEYLLLHANLKLGSDKTKPILQANTFREAVEDYLAEVKRLANQVLQLMAHGLGLEREDAFSRMLEEEESDSYFRLNHYPPCPDHHPWSNRTLVGFGEHTDPQIISVLKSNNTSGLQICLPNGLWVTIPPDEGSFIVNVGDAMQVMTNGRFKSVKHRVMVDSVRSRMSMIYFGGPSLGERIGPLEELMEGGRGLYKEFTWREYKSFSYKSKLGDNRLSVFEKRPLNV